MKSYFLKALFIASLFGLLAVASPANAQNQHSLLCEQSESPEEFVRQSIALCLEDLPSQRTRCMRDAEVQFYRCNFTGNFRRMSNRIQSKIILLSFFKNLVTPKNVQVGLSK